MAPPTEEAVDVVAFQASLDDSVASVRALVDSWIPADLGPAWTSASGSGSNGAGGAAANDLALLKKRQRPERMGLGADPTEIHRQQAEDRKTRDRLLRGTDKKSADAEIETPAAKVGKVEEQDDDDEEESRAGAIKGKNKASTSKPLPAQSSTPSQPSTSTSKQPTSQTPSQPLSKNQRKKERKRQKEEEEKRVKTAAVQAEERQRLGLPPLPASPTPFTTLSLPPKRDRSFDSDVDEPKRKRQRSPSPLPPSSSKLPTTPIHKLPRSLVQPPFAPLTSDSGGEGTPPAARPNGVVSHLAATTNGHSPSFNSSDEDEDEDGEGASTRSGTGSLVAMGQGSPDPVSGDKKKKKRRKKKKGKQGGESALPSGQQGREGVLDLRPVEA